MSRRVSRALSDRPVGERDVLHFINRELLPVVRELLRVIQAKPVGFSWLSGAASINVSESPDFVADDMLTQDSTLTLLDGYDGAQGTIIVEQDAVGGWSLAFDADGRTLRYVDPLVDAAVNGAPDSTTLYRYMYMTLDDIPQLVIERVLLT